MEIPYLETDHSGAVVSIARIVLFLSVVLSRADAQCTWHLMNSHPTSAELRAVCMLPNGSGWATGEKGTVISTGNGGQQWVRQESGTAKWLRSVDAADAQRAWIAGDQGTILHTTNGGTTWTPQSSGTTQNLWAIRFASATVGWAAGGSGTVLKTTDGGAHWAAQNCGTTHSLYALAVLDTSHLWVVGDEAILHSSTGGVTWESRIGGTNGMNYAADFISDSLGCVGNYNSRVHLTVDAGTSWLTLANGLGQIYSICASAGGHVGAAGPQDLLISNDSGWHWKASTVTQQWSPRAVAAREGGRFTLVGAGGLVATSSDSGRSWTHRNPSGLSDLAAVCFFGPGRAVAVGKGGIASILSPDKAEWRTSTVWSNNNLYAVHFLDTSIGWVGGDGVIQKTTDGGRFWTDQSDSVHGCVNSLLFTSAQRGWAAGSMPGGILGSIDGGSTWTTLRPGEQDTLYTLDFLDEQTGWAAGAQGRILYTNDGGTRWTVQNSSNEVRTIRVIDFINTTHGWAAGSSGLLLRSTDGGNRWTTLIAPDTTEIRSLHFVDEAHGWMSSTRAMYRSSDGGSTWMRDTTWPSPVAAVAIAEDENAWAVGPYGIVLNRRCATSGVQQVRAPGTVALEAAYPNPFSGGTTISFVLANTAQVRLEVYSIYGERVAQLLDAVLSAGKHQTHLDATRLPIGMYRAVMTVIADGRIATRSVPLLRY
jgi:photosystem II stability/assembly factor-like uncharacterized protein